MRLELWFIFLTSVVAYNVWYDNSLLKIYHNYKKHLHILGIVFGALILYQVVKRGGSPDHVQSALKLAKMTPYANTIEMFQPILDFTQGGSIGAQERALALRPAPTAAQLKRESVRVKRSVSGFRKKKVAAMQNWLCGYCGKQLDHLFEIDHKLRLADGGTNDETNLIAACPACHRSKTHDENARDI